MGDNDSSGFDELNLDYRVLKAIAKLGWKKPTLIQEKAIPLSLAGRDVVARAKTGSGKTAAFAIPLIEKVIQAKQAHRTQCIRGLVIAPAKELASQLCEHINTLAMYASGDVTCVDLIKMDHLSSQKILLRSQPDIIVSTPSKLLDQLKEGNVHLSDTLEFLVADEADMLLSFGYESDLREILRYLPKTYQAFLTSATLNDEVVALKKLLLHNPVVLKLNESQLPSSAQLIQYHVSCTEEEKFVILCAMFKLKLIKGKSIIFLQTIDRCFKLKLFLGFFGVQAVILNSELPVNSRWHIVQQFNKDLYSVLIASDEIVLENPAHNKRKQATLKCVLRFLVFYKTSFSRIMQIIQYVLSKPQEKESSVSRGIDFNNVSNVINFDFPKTVEEYVHRVGRTARAWNQGTALSFSTERDARYVARVKKVLAKQVDESEFLKPYRISMEELDGFRYRCLDALHSVTSLAIREARLKEIKEEALKSEKLKSYFAENPRDLQLIRHDKPIQARKGLQHLKHVPDYIGILRLMHCFIVHLRIFSVPRSLRGTKLISMKAEQGRATGEKGSAPKRLSYHQRKAMVWASEFFPLAVVSTVSFFLEKKSRPAGVIFSDRNRIRHFAVLEKIADAFVCGLDVGLRIYNSDPLVELASLDQEVTGSVKLCIMLHRTNLVALVGGGPRQKFSDHSVMIWDDDKKCFVAEVAFPSEVLSLKMSYAKLVVVLRKQVHVFSFPGTPTKLVSLETRENPHGLCALSADLTMEYLAFPGYRTGSVQLTNLKLLSRSSSASPSVINAHDSELACISLNCQGSLLATASERGTLIRIFSTQKKTKLLEVRRGSNPASIYSIRFNSESSFISVTSDKGTVHVFAVKDPNLNRRSTFHKVGIMGAYVESLWATAKYSLNSDSQCFCGFGRGSTLIVVSVDGSYHKLAYNVNGTCSLLECDTFLNVGDDNEFWNSYKR
ncbi:Helicase C and DEAD domain containing protein [Trichuris trichiura]|uniref:RNA helicase n=1 Tax=Trichuris trichiura TaxID=36087 RepID=A0A077YVW4_TRITR|nr:Helicase C and DEAD domain containing protein [Trichuris trichiura]